jgi:peptidoglycan/xylan/chitin deacetylase (PgdA/CDA1 family)
MSVLQERIKELAKHHGSMRVLGRVLEVDHAYLYRLSTGETNDPGDDLLRKLKLRRVVSYERLSPPSTPKQGEGE